MNKQGQVSVNFQERQVSEPNIGLPVRTNLIEINRKDFGFITNET